MEHKEITLESVDWINFSRDRGKRAAFVKALMKLWVI